ncbi:MAG: EamA family transporter, partial [Kiritimatiellae bacterium]|nr:EamA family transporter [Kiritimatiellia bacterium]
FVLWSFACRRVGTAKATLLTYLTPIVTCLAATIFCEDTLSLETAFGILLVLSGLIVADFRNIPLARHGNH